jgi:hypothetical protein
VHDGVTQTLHRYAAFQARRILTQMDRDPGSPSHGCFDRNHWHYKIRDFPSAILQQGAFTLEALRRGDVRLGVEPTQAGPWALAAVNALSRQVDDCGRVDEYFPFEASYPAGAFGLYVAARLAWDWERNEPALARGIDWPGLRRLARHMTSRIEPQASNQYAAGIAGLALAARVPQFSIGPEEARRHADRLFASQHDEGWFEEYGGPDFGYLTVTLDALADYGDATGDPRVAMAVQRAVEFLAGQVGADGALPSSLNSRNTDYVVPYGLVRAAARLPAASWLVHRLFAGADDPGHFLWATDDRYHCHYVYASVVRSLPNLGAMVPPAEPDRPARLWLPGCGFLVARDVAAGCSVHVGARKGGLVRVHRQGAVPVVDHGWRIRRGKGLWTTNWWSSHWKIGFAGDRLTLDGQAQAVGYTRATVLRHMVLRMLSRVLHDRVTPLLKRIMIFRKGSDTGARFCREVLLADGAVRVTDRFGPWEGAQAEAGPRQNLRHVASADSFHVEEWLTPLLGDVRLDLSREAQWITEWRPQAGKSEDHDMAAAQ